MSEHSIIQKHHEEINHTTDLLAGASIVRHPDLLCGELLSEFAHACKVGLLLAAPFLSSSARAQEEGMPVPPAVAQVDNQPLNTVSPVPRSNVAGDLVHRSADTRAGVVTTDGTFMPGVVRCISADSIGLAKDPGDSVLQRGETLISAESVLRIVRKPAELVAETQPVNEKTTVVQRSVEQGVVLSDNSLLAGSLSTFTHKEALVVLANGFELKVPREQLRALRFVADSAYDAEWQRVLNRERPHEELLVIKKSGGILDHLRGVVGEISADHVTFLLDGDSHKVSRSKVFGIVLSQAQGKKLPSALCRVASGGNRLACRSLTLEGDTLDVTTVHGLRLQLAATEFLIDYSPSKTLKLSEFSPVVSRWNPIAQLKGDARISAMLDRQTQPFVTRQVVDNHFLVDQVQLSGDLSLMVPLRGQALSLHARVSAKEPDSTLKIVVHQQNGQRSEFCYCPDGSGRELVVQIPLLEARSVQLDVPPSSRLELKDLYFVRKNR